MDEIEPNCADSEGNGGAHAQRRRSSGTLSEAELRRYRETGIALAFDPVQLGWIPADAIDDITPRATDIRTPADGAAGAIRQTVPEGGLGAFSVGPYRMRSWIRQDVATYIGLLDDPAVWQQLPEEYPGSITPELAEGLIEISQNPEHHIVFAVACSGPVIGQVRLVFGEPEEDGHDAEVSYWFGRSHWGKGHATTVVPEFVRHCFEIRPGLRSVWARVHQDNPASARVLTKSGFQLAPEVLGEWRIYRRMRA